MIATQPRNVTVFGATGNIGRHVVDQLLADGHTVTAYVRNQSKVTTTRANLRVVEGDLTDDDAIARAVDGASAVISALGPNLKRSATGTPRLGRHPHHRQGHESRRRAPL